MEVTGMSENGCQILNDGKFALFLATEGVVGLHKDKMKNWRLCSYGNFGEKSPITLAY